MNRLAIFALTFSLLPLGCWDEGPFMLTNDLPDVDPEKPVDVHLCISYATDSEKYLGNLCKEYPYSWAEGCEANEKLQTCEEFVVALSMSCPTQDTCDYEKCSLALQQAPCGKWPETCQQVVSCVNPEWPMPEDGTSGTSPTEDVPTTG